MEQIDSACSVKLSDDGNDGTMLTPYHRSLQCEFKNTLIRIICLCQICIFVKLDYDQTKTNNNQNQVTSGKVIDFQFHSSYRCR